MALLTDYRKFGASRLKNFTTGVINGLGNSVFSSLATAVTALLALNNALRDSILPFNESTKATNDIMLEKKALVIKKLNEMRPLVEEICGGDFVLEQLSGFTPSKRGRSRRTSIEAAQLDSAVATTVAGQLLITIHSAVPGNQGFEVHYTIGTNDHIVGVYKVKGRTLQFVASGFPSSTPISVYLITLSTNNVRSDPSNSVPASAL